MSLIPMDDANLLKALRRTTAFKTNDPYKKSEKEQKIKNRWKFVRNNRDIIIKPTVIETLHEARYQNISDIPTVSEITRLLMSENRTRGAVLQMRRESLLTGTKIDDKHFKEVIDRQILAKNVEEDRRLKQQSELSKLIKILRTKENDRTDIELGILLDWMTHHCPKNAVISSFLSKCTQKEAFDFCRGLNYVIFDVNEAIIRQGDIGDIYYILLSGKALVYVNETLADDEIANEHKAPMSPNGIGQCIDVINPGLDFGELALLERAPRSASIIASNESAVECLCCTDAHFQKCINVFALRCTQDFMKDLSKFYVMRDVKEMHIHTILKRFVRSRMYSGSKLCVEGKRVKNVYFVIRGQCVEMYKSNQISLMDCTNTVIGAYDALKHRVSLSTIVCKSDCDVICCSVEQFIKSCSITMHRNCLEIGQQRMDLLMQKIANYEKMKDILSKVLNKQKNTFNKKNVKKQSMKSKIGQNKFFEHRSKSMVQRQNETKMVQSQRRIRSVSLYNDLSITQRAEKDYNKAVNVLTARQSQKELLQRTLPKRLKEAKVDKNEKNAYIKNKKRFRSLSLVDLKKQYGVPTDVWQIDLSHDNMLKQSLYPTKNDDEKRNILWKSYSNQAVKSTLNYTEQIIKKYDALVPTSLNRKGGDKFSRVRKRRKRSQSMQCGLEKQERKRSVSAIVVKNIEVMKKAKSGRKRKRKQRQRSLSLGFMSGKDNFTELKRTYRSLSRYFQKQKNDRIMMTTKQIGVRRPIKRKRALSSLC